LQFGADILLLAVFLFTVQEWLRRKGARVGWGIFCLLPLLLTPVWILGNSSTLCRQFGNPVFFCWLKLYSVSIAACWITWLRFTPTGHRSSARFVSMLILPVNILEAVLQDISTGQWEHYLNAISGALLVVTLPYTQAGFHQRTQWNCRDFEWDGMTRVWIVGYTVWNWVFIYLTYPVIAGQHVAVLAASLAVGLLEPRRWLQARTYSLAVALFLLFSFPSFLVSRMGTAEWSSARGDLFWAILSLGFNMICAANFCISLFREFTRDRTSWRWSRGRSISEMTR
jgi:hypothetical protein